MEIPCHILHVEDSPDDAELVSYALRGTRFGGDIVRVENESDFIAQLEAAPPAVVLCDYDLPRFSATRALHILQERGGEIPLILVSHHIGESAAIVAMQQGASDYLSKGDLGRLSKAIDAAIDRSKSLREKARAQEALRESEAIQRGILDSLTLRIALLDRQGMIRAVNGLWRDFCEIVWQPMNRGSALPGSNYLQLLDERSAHGVKHADSLAEGIRAVLARQSPSFTLEYELSMPKGARWYHTRVTPMNNSEHGAVVSHEDVTERVMIYAALHDANRRLRSLSKRILAVQEEERNVLSRELHDDVSQTLGSLKIGLHRLAQGSVADPAPLVAQCLAEAEAALERLRSLAHELRPPQLDHLGLEDALEWLATRQSAATGLQVQCAFPGGEHRRVPHLLESACFRIAQEALSNASKHAQAKIVRIAIDADDRLLKLTIRDDGVGFDEQATRERTLKAGNMGLVSMEERAQLAGGRLRVRTVVGGGTTVSAIFPLDNSVEEADLVGSLASIA